MTVVWTTPYTWIAGTPLPAAKLNEQLRDNISMTAPAIATVAGDLVRGTGVGTGGVPLARLGIGSAGDFLQVVGGLPVWGVNPQKVNGNLPASASTSDRSTWVDIGASFNLGTTVASAIMVWFTSLTRSSGDDDVGLRIVVGGVAASGRTVPSTRQRAAISEVFLAEAAGTYAIKAQLLNFGTDGDPPDTVYADENQLMAIAVAGN